jgi:hypothetical protein
VKPSDSAKLGSALNSLGFTLKPTPRINPNPTNCLAYGSEVSENDVKVVALALIRAGVSLQGIQSSTLVEVYPPLTIQVFHNPYIEDWPPLTTDAIAVKSLAGLKRPEAVTRPNIPGVVADFDVKTHRGTIQTSLPGDTLVFFETLDMFKKGDPVIFVLFLGPYRHYAEGVRLRT